MSAGNSTEVSKGANCYEHAKLELGGPVCQDGNVATEIRWYAKATAVLLLICLVLFFAPLLIGVWLPDVASAPRNVLAEERGENGEMVRVIQYWNRVDFYSTELHYTATNGVATVCTLDGDDSKHWSVPLEVDWETKKAKVTLDAGRLRVVDLVAGEWER